MKAIVQERFGPPDVLQLVDTDLPEGRCRRRAGSGARRRVQPVRLRSQRRRLTRPRGRGGRRGNSRRFFDRTYPLADAADGLRYVEQGHAHGKVVITMA
jgi:hypothetical protein